MYSDNTKPAPATKMTRGTQTTCNRTSSITDTNSSRQRKVFISTINIKRHIKHVKYIIHVHLLYPFLQLLLKDKIGSKGYSYTSDHYAGNTKAGSTPEVALEWTQAI